MLWRSANQPRQILAGILIVIFLYGMVLSAKRGCASVFAYILQQHLNTWAENKVAPAYDEWNEVKSYFVSAFYLTPNDPAILQQGGRLYEWRHQITGVSAENRQEALEQALQYFQLSIVERPLWPYTWLDFVIAKVRANRLDAQFQHALRLAFKFGQWEPQIQLALFDLGLSVYSELDAENQKNFYLNMNNASIHQAANLIAIAEEHHEMSFLCRELELKAKLNGHCKN